MRLFFAAIFLILGIVGCAGVERVVTDYNSGVSNSSIVQQAQADAAAVGHTAALAAGFIPGMPVAGVNLIDKVVTVLACYLFVWHGGVSQRRRLADGKEV